MLKRNQVMLTDWLVEFIKFHADKYDVSFSEVIRLMLCMQIEHLVSLEYPKYKFGIPLEEVMEVLNAAEKDNKFDVAHHKLISKIYFETRKAAEFMLNKESAKKKRKD